MTDSYHQDIFPEFYNDLCRWISSTSSKDDPVDSDISLLREIVASLPKSKLSILELACGTGRIINALLPVLPPQTHLYASDSSPVMLSHASTLLKASQLYINPTLRTLPMQSLWKELENQIDLVILAAGSIHHLTSLDSLKSTISNISLYLKPNGLLYLDILSPESVKGPWMDQDNNPIPFTVPSSTPNIHWTRTCTFREIIPTPIQQPIESIQTDHFQLDKFNSTSLRCSIKETWSLSTINLASLISLCSNYALFPIPIPSQSNSSQIDATKLLFQKPI